MENSSYDVTLIITKIIAVGSREREGSEIKYAFKTIHLDRIPAIISEDQNELASLLETAVEKQIWKILSSNRNVGMASLQFINSGGGDRIPD